jgi:cell division protein FtsZ
MLNVDLPKNKSSMIKVLGVGGGGSNAVNHMYKQGIKDVDFIICNTDIQALEISPVPVKIQIGEKGLGAGSKPEVGKAAALEQLDSFKEILEKNTEMLFITAGMGGGTGTGAAPVIAELAREMGILTIGIVTIPFSFEGRRRKEQAEVGLEALRKNVDALLIISNDKLREIYGNLKITDAFNKADDVLTTAAKGIAEIITVVAHVNVDLQDIKTVMTNSGTAILGSAIAEGENRAINAVEEALSSPLLNDNHIEGAENILLYLSYGEEELTMDEISDVTDYIQDETGNTAEVIWGMGEDSSLGNSIKVTLIATGFNKEKEEVGEQKEETKIIIPLDSGKIINDEIESTIENSKSSTEEVQTISLKVEGSPDIEPISTNLFPEEEMEVHTFTEEVEDEEVDVNSISSPTLIRKKENIPSKTENEVPMDDARTYGFEKRLNELSMNFNSNLAEMEQIPAYMRKEVELKEAASSDESEISKTYLDDSDGNIKTRNTYLHDNVD